MILPLIQAGPHCPRCGHTSWNIAGPAHTAATAVCRHCGWIRGITRYVNDEDQPPWTDPSRPTAEDTAKYDALVAAADKRGRVRALVHTLLANPKLMETWGVSTSWVKVAITIDAEIESIGVTKDES